MQPRLSYTKKLPHKILNYNEITPTFFTCYITYKNEGYLLGFFGLY